MTVRRLYLLSFSLSTLLILSACSNNKKPSGILSHAEMVKALTQVYLSEQATNRLGLKSDSAVAVLRELKSKNLKKTEISDSAFNKSFNYYIDRPIELEEIYTALVDSLTLKEQLLDTPPPAVEKKWSIRLKLNKN